MTLLGSFEDGDLTGQEFVDDSDLSNLTGQKLQRKDFLGYGMDRVIFGEGDFLTRLSRIYFTVTAYDGSRFEAYYFDFSRRSHLILKREDSEGMGGTQRWITRTFTPADGGGRLLLTGEGNIRLHEITLAIQDAGT